MGPLFDSDLALDLYALGNIWPRTEDQPVDPDDPTLGVADQDRDDPTGAVLFMG